MYPKALRGLTLAVIAIAGFAQIALAREVPALTASEKEQFLLNAKIVESTARRQRRHATLAPHAERRPDQPTTRSSSRSRFDATSGVSPNASRSISPTPIISTSRRTELPACWVWIT